MSKKENKSRAFRFIYATLGWLVKILFGLKTVNPENEPEEGGYLICANHVSAIDAIAIAYAFKKNQAHLMAKKELFRIPLLRGLIKMLGAFPVDRGTADVGAIRKAVSMIEDGKSVGLFPQGHRYPKVDPRTTPIKNGAGLIALRAECDVVPVYILRKNNKFMLFRRAYVIIGKKIPYATLASFGEKGKVTQKIFNDICTLGESALSDPRIKL